jgi:outer membrane lipoprotein-sorting protein
MTKLSVLFAAFLTAGVLNAPPARAGNWGKCPASVKDLADKADRLARGSSSKGVMSMKVYKRGTVSMRMQVWSKGRNKFLAKILRPSRLRGMATLKSGANLWNYLPRQDRIMKLGSSMMGGSWMGSHFTNDDLVKETDMRKHYTCTKYTDAGGYMTIWMKPRPNAPVVWGKVVMKVKKAGTLSEWIRYYDERGKLKRTMKFERVRTMGGRTFPTRMVLQPADAPSERTVVTYHKMKFDVGIPSRMFTLQGLKR